MIEGMGNNIPVRENEEGGKQSDIPYAFHLIDSKALFRLAKVYAEGAKKYERDNWRKISVEEHLNHAISHIYAYLAGDRQENHLEHAQCRINMAVAIMIENEGD
jgi:hypothetical protein